MGCGEFSIHCPDQATTETVARQLAVRLRPGDTLLLQGDIGAGKSVFARAAIQELLARTRQSEEVPSPTFTLVQRYQAGSAGIIHADLYRLKSTGEVAETGIPDDLAENICLIEWPDVMGSLIPDTALWLQFSGEGIVRDIRFSWTGPAWAERLEDLAQ